MRKTTPLLILAALAALGLQGCHCREDDAKVRAAIEARNQEIGTAISRGDAAAVAALYTADAVAMPPHAAAVSGRAAIQGLWQSLVDSGVKGLQLISTDVHGHRDSADEEGTYQVLVAGGKVVDTGKYIVVWRRDHDAWFLHRDIWNSDDPPPLPPPPPEAPAAAPAPEQPPAPPRP